MPGHAVTSKYNHLADHLAAIGATSVTLTFAEIEVVCIFSHRAGTAPLRRVDALSPSNTPTSAARVGHRPRHHRLSLVVDLFAEHLRGPYAAS
ncbi:MAG: hypothetical protein ACR2OO_07075 [Thermomicrobiales bacterium]